VLLGAPKWAESDPWTWSGQYRRRKACTFTVTGRSFTLF